MARRGALCPRQQRNQVTKDTMSKTCKITGSDASMSQFTYATDSGSGTVEAASLKDAYQALRSKITDDQVADGATLWVEDSRTGERITIGKA